MYKALLGTAAFLLVTSAAFAQGGDKTTTFITTDDLKKVLSAKDPSVDHTVRVLDEGSYQLSVAVIHRDPPKPRPAGAAPAAAANKPEPCGLTAVPAGASDNVAGMIAHDDTVETYIVTEGSGVLETGGEIVAGSKSAPDSEVTKILNGPSCSGKAYGAITKKMMKVGDIAVIPAGVPHGWALTEPVTYLSIRPDPKKVLEKGYVYPTLK